MIGLWDTTGNAVVKALAAERRSAGGVTSGLALTLVAVVDEAQVREAEAAATIAAATHPCRLLIVVRSDATGHRSRLDAEVVVGGRLGPCEAVVMRMLGRLALHAESVVMPLLAPDVPVVTWWQCAPPDRIANDPLGVVAERRITDCLQDPDPLGALRTRASDYASGDTDLAWTRLTSWRTLIAGVFDAPDARAREITIEAAPNDPSAALLRGWFTARLGITPTMREGAGRIASVRLDLDDGSVVNVTRSNGSAVLQRTGLPDRVVPLGVRPLGEELAEELRRLDPDQTYAQALAAATGTGPLSDRPATRVHIWQDPGVAERPDPANSSAASSSAASSSATNSSAANSGAASAASTGGGQR